MKAVVLSALLALAAAAQSRADAPVYLYVLGVTQDAGYPQAGCYRAHCLPGWSGDRPRLTPSSIAVVDEDAGAKFLFDATPAIGDQLYRLQIVAPDDRFTLGGVFPTHAHIGHYAGLMYFGHEAMGAKGIRVFAMPRLREFLATNGPWDQLVRYENLRLEPLSDETTVRLTPRLQVTPMTVPHRDEYSETVGFRIEGPQRTALYLPDIDKWQRWDRDIRQIVAEVDYALVDATFYAHGELPGRDMSQVPHPLVTDSMALFAGLEPEVRGRVIFIHMNHTNPLLVPDSEAANAVRANGFRIAFEGMQLAL